MDALQRLAPGLDPQALATALSERALARSAHPQQTASSNDSILAVIDYSLPSTERRLWVFDLAKPALLFHELVAHGVGSGDNLATRFSNESGTRASSLGLYHAAEIYQGRNGTSLRLDGLSPGLNDQARARDIVMHGAWYVSEQHARTFGRLGRSWGCPALDEAVARPIIDLLHEGGWLYIAAEKLERAPGGLVEAVRASSR